MGVHYTWQKGIPGILIQTCCSSTCSVLESALMETMSEEWWGGVQFPTVTISHCYGNFCHYHGGSLQSTHLPAISGSGGLDPVPLLSWEAASCSKHGLWSPDTDVHLPGLAYTSLTTWASDLVVLSQSSPGYKVGITLHSSLCFYK